MPKKLLIEKTVIVINGGGGAGKDALCDAASRVMSVENVSAIDPIKKIALANGWDGVKDNRSRRFLSDLKRAFVLFNDLPNRYLFSQYESFMRGGADVLFVHIREADQIAAFVARIPTACATLLVRRPVAGGADSAYGNASDDGVEAYDYDYVYINDKPLAEMPADFTAFFCGMLRDMGALTDASR